MIYIINCYLALLPLWISYIIMMIAFIYNKLENKVYNFNAYKLLHYIKYLFLNYTLQFVLSVLLILLYLICALIFENYLKNSNNNQSEKIEIKNPTKNRTLTSEYLFTYVLPLFAFDINKISNLLCLIIYIFTIMFLVYKNSSLIGNIYLDLRKYNYYTCINNNNEFIIISKRDIKYYENDKINVSWINNDTSVHIV